MDHTNPTTPQRRTSRWWKPLALFAFGAFLNNSASATTCAGAINIPSAPVVSQAVVCGGTNDMTSANTTTCGSGSYKGGQEAVYTFTAGTTGTYNVAYSGVSWVGIFVYAGCPTSGGTCVGNVTSSATSKNLNVTLTAATQYYIVFDTYPTPNSPCPGTFSLTPPPTPCVGTPNPGNTTGPVTVGSGEVVNLSLQNATAGTGVTYQWYFSTTSSTGPWSNGGTAATYAPTQTVPTWYYATVTCSGNTGASNVLLVGISYCTPAPTSMDNQGIVNVAFSTVSNNSSAAVLPESRYGNYSAMIGNVTQGTTVPVAITYQTGYTYATKIWIDWNDDKDFNDPGEEVYSGESLAANPTTLNASFAVGTNPLGNHRMRIGGADTGTLIPCYTGSYATFEDYTINVLADAACAGTPAPGATTGPTAICVGDPVNLGLTNATLGSGVTYQWYESTTSSTGPWTSVGTGLSTYSPEGQTAQTWYYADVTCSGNTGSSSVLQVSVNAPSACYCTPGDFTSSVEPITLVNFAGINQSSCAAVGCDGDVVDYTGGTPGAVIAGQSYTITVKGNSDGSFTNYYTAFFDWDQNGTFEATQPIGSITGSTGSDALQASISIAVPLSAVAGSTRMRVIKNYSTSPTNPCGTYGFGQVEDYTINVSVPSCTAPAVTINVTPNCPAGFGVDVVVADYGDGASATINWSLNGVAQTPIAAAIGSNVLPGAPFAGGADVDVTVLHENDTDCNVAYNNNTYACPPNNDECANAVNLTVNADFGCGSVTAGTIALATASADANSCFGTDDDDVWYTFTATSTAHRVSLINITGSTSDMYMAISTGSCGSQTSVLCSDSETANLTGLTLGAVYTVRVYTYTSTPGQTSSFNICVGTPPPPPANDECANAVALTVNANYDCGSVTLGTITSATASADVNACGGTDDDDVWYTFTATSTAHRVSLINFTSGTTDMFMSISSGTCGSMTNVLCSDPETANLTGLTVGVVYTVRVYTWTSTPGQSSSFSICVGTQPPPPANDLCANAILVGANSVTPGTTGGASNTGNPGTCTTTLNTAPGVWYKVEGINGMMTADLCGAPFDTKIGIFTGTCGALTCLQGNDDDTGTNGATACGGTFVTQSSTSWLGLVGTTYYIYVTAYQTNSGPFNLTLSSVPGTSVVVAINTDSSPSEITWEITNGATVVATGGPSMINGLDVQTVMVSPTPTSACYGFTLTDSFGDGIIGGNWQLRSTSGKVLLGDDFANGYRSPSATPANPSYTQHSFCLPVGNTHIAARSCGIFNFTPNSNVYCTNAPGATSNQFEFSNPDAGFIRRITVNTNKVRFNQMVTSPLTPGVKYFVRARNNAAGPVTDAHFGGGCEVAMSSTIPCTELISAPQYGHSCNETRAFNPSTNNSFIYAQPVNGATEYQFRISIPGEGYDETFIRSTYILQLKWNATVAPPLVNGSTYNVQVNVKVGTLYSGFCGDVCTITIDNSANRPEARMIQSNGTATLWPNPVRESQVNLSIDGIQDADQNITVDIQDIYGKQVFAKEFGNSGERFSTILDLPGDVASGVYMVNITVNGKRTVQRLSIMK